MEGDRTAMNGLVLLPNPSCFHSLAGQWPGLVINVVGWLSSDEDGDPRPRSTVGLVGGLGFGCYAVEDIGGDRK